MISAIEREKLCCIAARDSKLEQISEQCRLGPARCPPTARWSDPVAGRGPT